MDPRRSPRTALPGLTRRHVLVALAALPLTGGLLAACGDDSTPDSTGADPTAPTESTEPGSVPLTAPTSIAHGTGPDDIVLRIDGGVGGFTTQEYAFQQLPTVLVMGDGAVLRPGAQIAIYPPPLLPAVEKMTVSEETIQQILLAAEEAGLLAPPPDYTEGEPHVTDVGSTVVTLGAGGSEFVHSAYALGLDADAATTPERDALQGFVDEVQTILLGTSNGQLFEPDEYEIWAQADDVANYTDEPGPTVQPWPAETGVALADASTCLAVPAASVQSVFDQANQLTFFEDGGVTYRLIVRPVLPGAERCPT